MISILTIKAESLYCACCPEWGVISYGNCRDEALNNLIDEIRINQSAQAVKTGYERNRQ